MLELVIDYGPVDPGGLSLSSGSVSSAHADFWNAWDQGKLETEVELCLRRQQVCAVSDRLSGAGRWRLSVAEARAATRAATAASASRWGCARTTRSPRGCGGRRRSPSRRAPPCRRRGRRGRWRRSPPARCAVRRCGAAAARACAAPRRRRGRCRGCPAAARGLELGDSAAWRAVSGRRRPRSGPAGRPWRRRPWRRCRRAARQAANAPRRSANCGSAASRRARSRSPPAAPRPVGAGSASAPSATRRSASAAAGIGPNSMRTQRDAIVTRSTGTKSASTTKCVDAGGSSIVFSRRPAPTALSRWNSWRISTLRSPSTGARAAWRTISAACSAEIAGPTRTTSRTSGCSPASASRASAIAASSLPVSSSGGERPGRLVLRRAGRADEQVGVHRRGGRRGAAPRRRGPGRRRRPDRSRVVRHATSDRAEPLRGRRRARRRRRRPWSPSEETTIQRCGSARRSAAVSVEDPLVERLAGAFEAVELATVEAVGDDVGVGLDEDDERRPHALHRPVVDPAQLVEVELAAVALVGERRVHAAIADHGPAGTQRREDDLGDVLGPVGGGDQRLGTGIELDRRRCRGGSGAAAGPIAVPPVSWVSTAPSEAASKAAWVLLPLPSAPSKAMYGGSRALGSRTSSPRSPLLRRRFLWRAPSWRAAAFLAAPPLAATCSRRRRAARRRARAPSPRCGRPARSRRWSRRR